MKNTAIIGSVLAVAVVVGIIVLPHRAAAPEAEVTVPDTTKQPAVVPASVTQRSPETPVKTPTLTPKTPSATTKYYTATEVSAHTSAASCWTSINGKVYDLTTWITRHPGGQTAIKQLCGTDGSDEFNGKHGGQPRPESELAGFYIGVLK